MANSKDKLSATNRAMLVGAILGGGASIAKQWKSHQAKEVQTNELCAKAAKDSIKAGLIAGGTTYVAGKNGRSSSAIDGNYFSDWHRLVYI